MNHMNSTPDIHCPFCNSDRIAYEGMYEMSRTAGVIILPASAVIFRCCSCKKLFFNHAEYEQKSNLTKINVAEWKTNLGVDLLACLIAWCVGQNRLYALLDLLIYSDAFDKTRSTARHDRDFTSALITTFGIIHELDHNLDLMMSFLVNKDGQIGKAIKKIKKVYNYDKKLRKILTEYRDKISHHFDLDVIKVELNQMMEGDIGFIKYDSQMGRDTYYMLEEISSRGFIREFFEDEISHALTQGKTFEEIYPVLYDEFIGYIKKVHVEILEEGDLLITAFLKEYNLPVMADSDK